MARPCEEGLRCSYEEFDYSNNCSICAIDYDGTDCPYIKPYGKRRYEKEQLKGGGVDG